jgi:hypothetical protein
LFTPCSSFHFRSMMSKHYTVWRLNILTRKHTHIETVRYLLFNLQDILHDSSQGLPEVGRLPKEHDRKAYGGRGDKLLLVDRRLARCKWTSRPENIMSMSGFEPCPLSHPGRGEAENLLRNLKLSREIFGLFNQSAKSITWQHAHSCLRIYMRSEVLRMMYASVIWHRDTDVSEEPVASIFRVYPHARIIEYWRFYARLLAATATFWKIFLEDRSSSLLRNAGTKLHDITYQKAIYLLKYARCCSKTSVFFHHPYSAYRTIVSCFRRR